MSTHFEERLRDLQAAHRQLITRANKKEVLGNGIYNRYQHPVLTAQAYAAFLALRFK